MRCKKPVYDFLTVGLLKCLWHNFYRLIQKRVKKSITATENFQTTQ